MRIGSAVLRMIGLCLLAGVLVAGLLFPAVGGVGLASNQASDTVNSVSSDLIEGDVPLVTTVTDKDGAPIAFLAAERGYRFDTAPEDIPDTMKAAIIAIEDRRFYQHDGVDWRGISRAALTNAAGGDALEGQGASTLTMQYVKNYFLYVVAQNAAERAQAVEATPARKLREIRVALQLEQRLSKEEILARYLNIVFFGENSYGVAAAARTYFNITPDQLTIAQAALLAGLVKSTEQFSPENNPEQALERRNLVIDSMVDVGSITPEQGAAARAEPLGIQQPLTNLPNGCVGAGPADGFYCDYAIQYLQRAGFDIDDLRSGGYLVRTNLDRRATDIAKSAANEQVPTMTEGVANTMAIVRPGRERHEVVALVANRDYGNQAELGQTSYGLPSTVAPHGAGSIYKTFTAAAALERGLGINTPIPAPPSYTSRVFKNGSDPYTVSNFGDADRGTLSIQDALAQSPNTAFVALADRLGSVDPVVDMAYRLGLRDSLAYPDQTRPELNRTVGDAVRQEQRGSYTLGPSPTSPLELANVAATLMSGGTWCPPTPIQGVFDRNGQPVPVAEAPCEQAVPEGLANTLAVGMSKDDLPGGTAAAAAATVGWDRPMLGKTGTTQLAQSAGFMGATPEYAGGVLVFADGPTPENICVDPVRLCGSTEGSSNIQGGRTPARTWYQAMSPLHEGLPVTPMPPTDPRYVTGGTDARVPSVVGQPENQARATVEQAGFRVQTRTVDSASSAGIVVSQSPSGAALPGDLVTLSISSGTAPEPETQDPDPDPDPTRPPGGGIPGFPIPGPGPAPPGGGPPGGPPTDPGPPRN